MNGVCTKMEHLRMEHDGTMICQHCYSDALAKISELETTHYPKEIHRLKGELVKVNTENQRLKEARKYISEFDCHSCNIGFATSTHHYTNINDPVCPICKSKKVKELEK